MTDPKAKNASSGQGLNQNAIADEEQVPLGGTGGSSGGGTRAGRGEPSGGPTDRTISSRDAMDSGSTRGRSEKEIAEEAEALGSANGSIADASSKRADAAGLPSGKVGGEAIGTSAAPGRGESHSGRPRSRRPLGGGGPLGQHGGPGPQSSDGGNQE